MRVVLGIEGEKVVSGSRDNSLKIWNISTRLSESTLTGHTMPVWSLLEIRSKKIIASGSADFTIRIWSLETKKCINTLMGHTMPIKKIFFLKFNFMLCNIGVVYDCN